MKKFDQEYNIYVGTVHIICKVLNFNLQFCISIKKKKNWVFLSIKISMYIFRKKIFTIKCKKNVCTRKCIKKRACINKNIFNFWPISWITWLKIKLINFFQLKFEKVGKIIILPFIKCNY